MKTTTIIPLLTLAVVLADLAALTCFSGRCLTNPDVSGAPELKMGFLRIIDTIADRRRSSPDKAVIPNVERDPARICCMVGPDEDMQLTGIGHESWLLQLEGKSFVIDPGFGELPGQGPARNVAHCICPEKLPTIDAVLITHNHYDHLDSLSLKRIDAPVIGGLGAKEVLKGDWCSPPTMDPLR